MSGECVISSVLSHHNKNLKWWASVTALRWTSVIALEKTGVTASWSAVVLYILVELALHVVAY